MTAKCSLEDFSWDAEANLYRHPTDAHFQYSDGEEIENRIYQILSNSVDTSSFSSNLISNITDWPTAYYFSPQRHNLLRHIAFKQTDRILELGAGCGAITRLFGERGATVTALEGSLARARCAAVRCKDLPDVKVYCTNFMDIEFVDQYDFVTFIGVLEYAPVYINDQPFLSYLQLAQKALKKGGKLIIAIENQLGLKYFSGQPEDHVGKQYFGIEGLYRPGIPHTLGREELKKAVLDAGFQHIEFQYPFPDYKFPHFVFTEQAFKCDQFAPDEIIRHLKPKYTWHNYQSAFDESSAWPTIVRNKLAQHLANSFLVIASDTPIEGLTADKNTLAYGYTTDRDPKCNIATSFVLDSEQHIVVKKRLLQNSRKDADDYNGNLIHTPGDEQYIKGKLLINELDKSVQHNDFNFFLHLLRLWLDCIIEDGIRLRDNNNLSNSLMKPEFIDCVPANIILTEQQGIVYIDREWRYLAPFMLGSLLLRCLHALPKKHRSFINQNLMGDEEFSVKVFRQFKLSLDVRHYIEYKEMDFQIRRMVYPWLLNFSPSGNIAEELPISTNRNIFSKKVVEFLITLKTKLSHRIKQQLPVLCSWLTRRS